MSECYRICLRNTIASTNEQNIVLKNNADNILFELESGDLPETVAYNAKEENDIGVFEYYE